MSAHSIPERIDTRDENLDLLLQVISLLPNAVHIKNSAHVWVELNQAFAELMGYSREELIGKTSFDVMPDHSAEVSWAQDDEVLRNRGSNRNVKIITNHKGESRWVEAQKCYFQSPSGNEYIIGVLTDLSEIKDREAKLIEARERALHTTRARATFLANMGSDIRDPMKSISKQISTIQKTNLTPYQSEIVNKMSRSGDTLFRIIDDIMDYSAIDAGLMQIAYQPFNPNWLVEHLASMLGITAREKRLDLIVSTDPDLPDFVRGDATRISQVLMNVAENSLKYTQRGYVHMAVSGRSTSTASDLVFTVTDTGPGIPDNILNEITGDFQDVANEPHQRQGVSGLGLSLCYKLVHLMGGHLEINSRIGKGTEIRIRLKLPVDKKRAPEKKPLELNGMLGQCKILIVDDVRANFDALQKKLKRIGLSADYAKSARVAANKLSTAYKAGAPYTIIFLDYLMPDVDGLLFANSIAQNPQFSSIEIIAMSSVNDPEVEECFSSSNLATYITKPITQGELETTIKAISVRETLKFG